MSIIAFDQSTTTVGYAIFEENELIQYGSFTPKQKKRLMIEFMIFPIF